MRRCVSLLACILLAGCTASNNKGRLEGTSWVSVEQKIQDQDTPEGHSKLTFGADKTFTYQLGENALKGKFSAGSEDQVNFYYDKPVAKKVEHIYTVQIQDNQLMLTDEQGNVRKFRKAG